MAEHLPSIIKVTTNVEDLVKQYRGRVNKAVLDAAETLTYGFRDSIKVLYSFSSPSVVDNYVQLRVNVGANLAHVRVVSKRFSLTRLRHIPPTSRKAPGYSTVFYASGSSAKIKAFPIKFKHGGIMATRSGVENIIEPSWQERQSAMTFTDDATFDTMVHRSKETVFETDVKWRGREYRRKHSFRKVTTRNTVEIAEKVAPILLNQISKDVNVEISRPPTEFWKMRKKKR